MKVIVYDLLYIIHCTYFRESCPAESHVLPGKIQKLSVRQIPKFQNLPGTFQNVASQIPKFSCPADSHVLPGKFQKLSVWQIPKFQKLPRKLHIHTTFVDYEFIIIFEFQNFKSCPANSIFIQLVYTIIFPPHRSDLQ